MLEKLIFCNLRTVHPLGFENIVNRSKLECYFLNAVSLAELISYYSYLSPLLGLKIAYHSVRIFLVEIGKIKSNALNLCFHRSPNNQR